MKFLVFIMALKKSLPTKFSQHLLQDPKTSSEESISISSSNKIKLGDFGLATKVDYDGERKRTLCGTPNYIAPEVLQKKGHSYEVDIWSLGCILYTLLVGKPPFETQTLKDTYARIKNNEYHIPSRVGPLARKLIFKLLQV